MQFFGDYPGIQSNSKKKNLIIKYVAQACINKQNNWINAVSKLMGKYTLFLKRLKKRSLVLEQKQAYQMEVISVNCDWII